MGHASVGSASSGQSLSIALQRLSQSYRPHIGAAEALWIKLKHLESNICFLLAIFLTILIITPGKIGFFFSRLLTSSSQLPLSGAHRMPAFFSHYTTLHFPPALAKVFNLAL